MTIAHILGFPRMGAHREWKFALETFWRSEQQTNDTARLVATAYMLCDRHWTHQRDAGLDWVTVGDFAWYDHVLDTLALVGGLPERFGFDAQHLTFAQYFQMARGNDAQPPMEMTKWFDTNYHYLVPEYTPEMTFKMGANGLFDFVGAAKKAGHRPKPVILGPLTLLWLGKPRDGLQDRLSLLPRLLPVYAQILTKLQALGIQWVQIDEPIFALDLPADWQAAAQSAYAQLAPVAPKLLLATYFGDVSEYVDLLNALPVAGLHIDLARAPDQLDVFIRNFPKDKVLSAGIIDGRNVWRHDLEGSRKCLTRARRAIGDRLWVAPSCSLLHVPMDLRNEKALDDELRGWLSFAVQKLDETVALRRALVEGEKAGKKTGQKVGDKAVREIFDAASHALATRRTSTRIHHAAVASRVAALTDRDAQRQSPYGERAIKQRDRFKLPLLPTTTIGSFPQTDKIRRVRADYKHGRISYEDYLKAMFTQIRQVIQRQEKYGLDVLVHGEPERNDMVEYFGELLQGFAITENGWVQSYGSRCVKPPLIYGDVYRPEPMTTLWTLSAQHMTDKPVKGMLTGPVTLLQWSFVRDDQPRATTTLQIALALRDEVQSLEKANIGIIQIDEPALREGLPLKACEREAYLDWAVRAFKIAASGAADDTQIHTHMCYSEFGDILSAIAALDADVISIETARSNMELLEAFKTFAYPNEIGPGVYDIHSPRIPSIDEMTTLIDLALTYIPADRLWINPDCGLKTRDWAQVEHALPQMVEAAKHMRDKLTKREGEACEEASSN